MSNLIERIVADDFVWRAITTQISSRQRRSVSGFVNINCPMCTLRGETPDKRMRCGIKKDGRGVGINCFNCGFKALWSPGDLLSKSLREFLAQIGMDETEIKRLNHKALAYRSVIAQVPEAANILPSSFEPRFPPASLPQGAKPLEEWANMPNPPKEFLRVLDYIYSRGEKVFGATTYYWTPTKEHRLNERVIIPFYNNGTLVGFTARSVGDHGPKYYSVKPPNYLFNTDVLRKNRFKYCILVEGPFDALAINGVAMLGSTLNQQQIAWLKTLPQQIILVPDRDRKGRSTIDIALENDWMVAFPRLGGSHGKEMWWDPDVKDVDMAVKRYGQAWTTLSIIKTATNNKIEININRRLLVE